MACKVLCAAACLVFVLFFKCATGHAAAAARVIEYIYVEANEGGSTGGHTAIRFDGQTFHFQHEKSGIIRIRRLDSDAFNYMYAILGNRTIRESLISVTDETYTLLLEALARLCLIQDAQLALRDELHRDIALFQLLLQRYQAGDSTTAEVSLPIRGLGYFAPHGPEPDGNDTNGTSRYAGGTAAAPQALVLLRDRIQATYGRRFIQERIAQTRSRIGKSALRAVEPSVAGIARDTYPGHQPGPSTRFYDALSALTALEQLQAAPPLRQGTFWSSGNAAFKLEPQEVLALKSCAEQQEARLISLVNSSRPDWGGRSWLVWPASLPSKPPCTPGNSFF